MSQVSGSSSSSGGSGGNAASSTSSSSDNDSSSTGSSSGQSTTDSLSSSPSTADNLSQSRSTSDNLSNNPSSSDKLSNGPTTAETLSDTTGTVTSNTPAANDNNTEDSAVASTVAGAVTAQPALNTESEATAKAELAAQLDTIKTNGTGKQNVVGAVVVDPVTGQSFTGVNQKADIPDLHPVLEHRLNTMDNTRAHNSYPGRHAEVDALNQALHARDQHYQTRNHNRSVTAADLPTMTLDTHWVKGSSNPNMQDGTTANQCANCAQITDGINNRAGVSTMDYSAPKATEAGGVAASPPSSPYAASNAQAFRNGALIGSAAGLGTSTFEALADGNLTGAEVRDLATDTVMGAGTGAAGEVIENTVTRAVDRAAGQGLQQSVGAGTRVVGSRIAGAGAAGAVIGAGFASVDQIQAYQRGEVTGSEAAGTVVAETATAAAAGVSGALAGAAVGSVIPVAGTAVGAVVGFGVGMVAGYAADRGLRAAGVTDAIASGVTSAIDTVSDWGGSLKSVFGW